VRCAESPRNSPRASAAAAPLLASLVSVNGAGATSVLVGVGGGGAKAGSGSGSPLSSLAATGASFANGCAAHEFATAPCPVATRRNGRRFRPAEGNGVCRGFSNGACAAANGSFSNGRHHPPAAPVPDEPLLPCAPHAGANGSGSDDADADVGE